MTSVLSRVRTQLGREQIIWVSIALFYVLLGWLGLQYAYLDKVVTPIFPAAGIAVGALLVLGYRVWPLILLGGVLLYSAVLGVTPVAAILAAANTGEGLLLAYLVNRFAGGRHALQTPKHAMRFSALTALTSVTCGATVATVTLALFSLVSVAITAEIWYTWAIGSFAGTILGAPLVLLFFQGRSDRWKKAQLLEAGAALICVVCVGLVVFWGVPAGLRAYPLEMLCFVVLLWPAFRLGRRAATLGLIVLFVMAVMAARNGHGNLLRSAPEDTALMVVGFMTL